MSVWYTTVLNENRFIDTQYKNGIVTGKKPGIPLLKVAKKTKIPTINNELNFWFPNLLFL